jgi:hypothetical protein
MAKGVELGPHVSPKTWFCRKFPWKIDIDWFDLTGTHAIDYNRAAEIELAMGVTHDTYPGMRVRIFSKITGEINSKYFKFDDYISPALNAREDGRADWPLGGGACYLVIAHCGWNWYIAIPRDSRPFCEAVERWVDTWRVKA